MARELKNIAYFKIETPQAAAKLRELIALGGAATEGPWDGEEAITLIRSQFLPCVAAPPPSHGLQPASKIRVRAGFSDSGPTSPASSSIQAISSTER
jgi:hypothetical protein